MTKQSVYKLDGRSPEDVKQSFVHYMGDKNATSKQIKDAANSRYVKIDTINVVCTICRNNFGVDNVYEIIDAGRIMIVSDALTNLINAENDEGRKSRNRKHPMPVSDSVSGRRPASASASRMRTQKRCASS